MKKLYKKGKVHPSPPLISDHLAFLPATILTLTAALSPEDREVLAYLISCSESSAFFSSSRKNTQKSGGAGAGTGGGGGGGGGGSGGDHPPLFNCNCFRCYMSYWVRWNSSPNHQLIHEIIDAFEGELLKKRNMKNKKERRKRSGNVSEDVKHLEENPCRDDLGKVDSVGVSDGIDDNNCEVGGDEEDEELEKGSVRRFMSFIGERIWGVWTQ